MKKSTVAARGPSPPGLRSMRTRRIRIPTGDEHPHGLPSLPSGFSERSGHLARRAGLDALLPRLRRAPGADPGPRLRLPPRLCSHPGSAGGATFPAGGRRVAAGRIQAARRGALLRPGLPGRARREGALLDRRAGPRPGPRPQVAEGDEAAKGTQVLAQGDLRPEPAPDRARRQDRPDRQDRTEREAVDFAHELLRASAPPPQPKAVRQSRPEKAAKPARTRKARRRQASTTQATERAEEQRAPAEQASQAPLDERPTRPVLDNGKGILG